MSLRLNRELNRRRQKRVLKWIFIICGVIIAIFIVRVLYSYGVNSISKYNTDIVVPAYGTMGTELTGRAVILNEEDTAYAPSEGRFENMVKENDKVRMGDLTGYFITASGQQRLLASTAGIFTRKTDGLEKVFQSVDINTVTSEVFKYRSTTEPEFQKHCYAGYPIYKIVNNLRPTRLLIEIMNKDLDTAIKPDQQIQIDYGKYKFNHAVIQSVGQETEQTRFIAELDNFYPQLLGLRYIDIKLLVNPRSGYVIPQNSLVTHSKIVGIYCLKGQQTYFKQVKVLKASGQNVLVEGIKENDMVVAHPGFWLKYIIDGIDNNDK